MELRGFSGQYDVLVAIRTYLRCGFADVPQASMDEWNVGQPIAYRWMRYAGSN